MGFTFDISGSQINGARDYQEDAFLITHLSDPGDGGDSASLVVVADGMGGHAAGNVASNMAVQTFNKHVTSHYPGDNLHDVLKQAVLAANNSITETVKETPALKGMGCTLVGAVFSDKYIRWVSVGDSHLYLLRDKQLTKKNANHSYGGFLDRMAAAGKPIEPEAGFSRNMLMSALTGDEIAEIDCPQTPLELRPGDRIIISSDGLDSINIAKVIYFSDSAKTARECVAALLKGVEAAKIPRQDNTTVLVIDVIAREEKAAPAPAKAPATAQVARDRTEPRTLTEPQRPKPQVTPRPAEDEPESKSKLPLIASVAAALAILGGGAAYFLMGPATKPHLPPAVMPPAESTTTQPATTAQPSTGTAATIGTPATATPSATEKPAAQQPAEKPAAETPKEIPPAPTVAKAGPVEEFRDKLKSGGEGPAMVWIPAGSFEMGSPNFAKDVEERPRHIVKVRKFAMSRYEVTIAEYEKFAHATGRPMPDTMGLEKDAYPVIFVSWDDALYYTRWLSEQTGVKYRLPSEAEWEYAAAAGADTYYWWWGREPGENYAHCFGCGDAFDSRKPAKVGSFKPNPFGLYDTAGNVAEWVYDCYHKNYDGAPDDGSVWEGGDCSTRVVRGGSYGVPPKSIRPARRDKFRSDKGNDSTGIRIVREP